MIPIVLTHAEMWSACSVGVQRQLVSVRKGLNQYRYGIKSNFQGNIEGAIAEACFAKYLNVYWSCSVNTFKAPDVGDWQVRGTAHPNGHLIVRPGDLDDDRVAFLTVNTRGAVLHGWMRVGDAKADEFWRDEHHCWFVPQALLTPFETAEVYPMAAIRRPPRAPQQMGLIP